MLKKHLIIVFVLQFKKKITNERPKSIQPNNYRHIISYSRCNSFFQFYIQARPSFSLIQENIHVFIMYMYFIMLNIENFLVICTKMNSSKIT